MVQIRFTQVREFYARSQPDGHWFDAGAMKFFKTKLPDVAYEGSAGVLFVTSEVNTAGQKRYSVRRQAVDGQISTVGKFHFYVTAAAARAEIKRLHTSKA